MRINRLKCIALLSLVLCTLNINAAKSYSCDFEDEAARNRWVLKTFANSMVESNIANKWYLGSLGNNTPQGEWGIYISYDKGVTNDYTNKGCFVFAYDTVTLDHLSSGDYLFTFDYRGMGNVASNFDGLYAFWVPVINPVTGDSMKIFSSPNGGQIPSQLVDYVIQLQPLAQLDYLNAASTWQQCSVKLPNSLCDGKPHYLAFAWGNTSSTAQQPGGNIDNIVIADDRPCEGPSASSLKVDIKATVSTFSWNSTGAMSYEAYAFDYTENRWYGPVITTDTMAQFANLAAGQVDFYVRSWCAEDLASLRVGTTKLVYYPDEMCVDYLNLDKATCYVNRGTPTDTRTYEDFAKTSPVDFGPYYIDSRHTIHYDHRETDQRANNELKTIPDEELASVRLGNWKNGAEAERIEFSFVVDTISHPVLLLKYATLLEAPSHDDADNPRFKLDLLIGNRSIGACGKADFNCNDVYNKQTKQLLPGAAEQGWHITPSSIAGTSADVVWKDWTTVGVNLKNPAYQGKKLTARLTTFDCPLGAHSGYAYFTLSCSDGNLKDMKCGEMNPVFKAPDGFVYRWIKAIDLPTYRRTFNEALVKWRTQEVTAGYHDDTLYVVDCMFTQDTTCFFTLYASSLATNPVPVIKVKAVKPVCKEGYYVTFDGHDSYIRERFIDPTYPERSYDRKSDIYHTQSWEWTCNGQVSYDTVPTFKLPPSKGSYTITLRTTYGTCDSTTQYVMTLDTLTAERDTLVVTMCDDVLRKKGYQWAKSGKTYNTFGLDSVVTPTLTCDRVDYLCLNAPVRVYTDTMLFDDQLPLRYHGREYYSTTVDTIYSGGCDTSWILHFEVYESLSAAILDTLYQVCPNEKGERILTIGYVVDKGASRAYSIAFGTPLIADVTRTEMYEESGDFGTVYTKDILLTDDATPNIYKGLLTLYDTLPQYNAQFPFTFYVNYPNTFLTQRWNDLMVVKNASYNGGYTFDEYQWYKGDDSIQGANKSYYYAPNKLDYTAQYKVWVKRASDQVRLWICPCQPEELSEAQYPNIPSLVAVSTEVMVSGRGVATWFDVMGNTIGKQSYEDSGVMTPARAGVYFMQLQVEGAPESTYRIMVK